jgi:hypothetical protein
LEVDEYQEIAYEIIKIIKNIKSLKSGISEKYMLMHNEIDNIFRNYNIDSTSSNIYQLSYILTNKDNDFLEI